MTIKEEISSIPPLLGDALSQFAKLFQIEVDLAKAELTEKAQKLAMAVAMLAVGAVLVIPALTMLLFALASGLIAAGWSAPVSYLVAAIVAFIIAAIFFYIGINRLDAKTMVPKETISQLEKDKDTIKRAVR